jgi:hypothetical protein
VALGEMTIYHRWDGFACLKQCKISKLEHKATIPILALHEVETPPTPPKSIHMVSGVMLVEGY